jgi:hypothetical protein
MEVVQELFRPSSSQILIKKKDNCLTVTCKHNYLKVSKNTAKMRHKIPKKILTTWTLILQDIKTSHFTKPVIGKNMNTYSSLTVLKAQESKLLMQ